MTTNDIFVSFKAFENILSEVSIQQFKYLWENQEMISLALFKINLEGHQNPTLDCQNLKSYMW